MQEEVLQALNTLRMPSGLYLASPSCAYHYVWIRDNCYIALADLHAPNHRFEQTYYALLDIFRKHESKLAYHSKRRPHEVYEYIHPRYVADTLEEIWEPWGNAQNDAIGAFLFGIGEGLRNGRAMLRDSKDKHIVSLLIKYLENLQFWEDEDNGMWEEVRERHASSIGACTAGLLALQPYFDIDWQLSSHGLQSLFQLLPRESDSHDVDLAQLSLIYPYRLLPYHLAKAVVDRVEQHLLRSHGVIRYQRDHYYGEKGVEAQWCMGLPWLGLCHLELGNRAEAKSYLQRTHEVMAEDGRIPELILGQQKMPNENFPLGWANSLYLQLALRLADGLPQSIEVRGAKGTVV